MILVYTELSDEEDLAKFTDVERQIPGKCKSKESVAFELSFFAFEGMR